MTANHTSTTGRVKVRKLEFDTQLTPGKHKLALQLGDDLHDTMPGTCTMITVNVKP